MFCNIVPNFFSFSTNVKVLKCIMKFGKATEALIVFFFSQIKAAVKLEEP